ncbi:hypothetical protein H0H92_000928 [Tricholoma furcatifolium]|nr:hypothetical protein H0H92_000928 [Tricholoma furcatifolium]
MLSIALIVSGSVPDSLRSQYGDYGAVFTRFLNSANPNPAVDFKMDVYDVVNEMRYPSEAQLDTYHALLYTGSAASAHEDVPWITTLVAFTKRIAHERPNIKLIGICFGHQIIARALGGTCTPNPSGWEVGPTPLELTDIGKDLFGVDTLNIQQMHRDHIPLASLPPSASVHLLASTALAHNQGMVRFSAASTPAAPSHSVQNIHIITLQGHPEFVEGLVSGIVSLRSASGIIPPDVAADYAERREWRNDGVGVVGRVVWGVLTVAAAGKGGTGTAEV